MKQQEITIGGKKFKITYPTQESHINLQQGRGLIEVTYYPEYLMLSHDAEKVLDKHSNELLQVIDNIMTEHGEFYNKFKFMRMFTEGGSQSGYNDVGQEGVITAHCRLILRLKEE